LYTVRLLNLSSFKLNIHNQCLNIDLVSPVYVTNDELECCRSPDHKACARDIMRSRFIIDSGNVYDSALICRLQRNQTHESAGISEDTSNIVYLLVTWCIPRISKLYADVLLVECDKKLDWNKSNLIDLYRKNFDLFRWFSRSATNVWSLNDKVALMITFEIMDKDHILDITISELERDNAMRTPAYIDSERYV
jgi:hypothetical protein